MTQAHITTEVLIVGGGIVGLSAAIAMSQRGFRVAVLDKGALQTPGMQSTKRVYALNAASVNLLKSLKIWQHLDTSLMSPYRQMHIWDAANHATLDFDARALGKSELGFILEEDALKSALLKQCSYDQVNLYPETEAQTLTETDDAIIVHTVQHTFSASFLFITDGAQSNLRQQLNIPMTTWPYHQHAIVATIQTKAPHQETAYQVFTQDGPLAFLPLNHPNQCSIVWSTSPTKANALLTLTEDAFEIELKSTFEGKLGACSLLSSRQSFPLHMRHTQQYHGQHWVLMGDAAHTIHPLAGLGLNLGLADLQTWLTLSEENKSKLSTQKRLSAYQRARKNATWQVIALMEALKMTFSNPVSWIQCIRGLGVNTINHLAPLKRIFMAYAAGE
jgi:2-octaprenylphenol hydroxylase